MTFMRKLTSSLLLILALVFVCPVISHAATTGDAFLYFGSSGSGSTPESYRFQQSGSSWACNATTVAAAGTIEWIRGKQAPDSEEIIIGVKTNTNVLYVQRYFNGTWTNEWNATLAADRLDFDVVYEQSSGDAIVVYSSNGSGQPRYRIWNGTSWTAELNVGNTFAGTGEVMWLEATERPGTDEVAIAWTTASSNVGAMVWDGSSWSCGSGLLANSLEDGNENYRQVEIEYEQSSGDLLVMWAPGSTDLYARQKTAGTCTWNYANLNTSDEATNISAAANPGSNEILVASIDIGSNDLQYMYWSGSAWSIYNNADGGCDAESGYRIMTAAAWAGSRGAILYADNYGTNVDYALYDGYLSATADWTPTPVLSGEEVSLLGRSLDSSNAMFIISDKGNDLWAKLFPSSGSAADTEGGTALEATLSTSSAARPFELVPIRFSFPTLVGLPAGTQPETIVRTDTDIVMGSFSFSVDTGSTNITDITITETGTIDAAASLTNVELWYDTDGTWSGNETQFGSTTGFNASSQASFSGSISIGTSNTYIYVVTDLGASASLGQTAEIEITAITDISSDSGDRYCSYPLLLTGTSTVSLPTIEIGTTGSQPTSVSVDSSNIVLGIFTMDADALAPTLASITVSETGTLNAQTYITNVELWYDTEGVFDGDETQLGTTTGFNASQQAAFSGTLQTYSTQTVYAYLVGDIGGGVIAGQTIDIQITGSGDVTSSIANIGGTFPVSVSGTTTVTGGQASTITVSPDTATVETNSQKQFSVSGTDTYGNSTTELGTITWSVNGSIGNINPSTGLFSSTQVGSGSVTASSSYGPSDTSGTVSVIGTEPNGNWDYRKRITVTNNVATELPAGYSVMFTFDHQTCYNGGSGNCSFSDGRDVRIFYFDGDEYVQIDRVNEPGCEGDVSGCTGEGGGHTPWNDTDTEIWFALQQAIPASGSDDNYWLYYGNDEASSAPDDPDNVYIWYDDFSSDTLSSYSNGKSVDVHGDNTSLVQYNAANENATFDTGDNYGAGLRINSLSLDNVLVQVDQYVDAIYPSDGTSNFTMRWQSNVYTYYVHISNGTYDSPCIAIDSTTERNCFVAGPTVPNTYFPSSGVPKRFRYGAYQSNHYFWYHDRTYNAPDLTGTDGTYSSGQVGIQANQQRGWFDNLLVRYFAYPEPTLALGTEESNADFKVQGIHTFVSQVSQGETNAQMLRLSISTSESEQLTGIVVTSKNTDESDIEGVSAYYTGTNDTFESSTPFGTEDQTFSGGTITFTGSQTLASDSTSYVFIVYNVSPVATSGDVLDIKLASATVTLTSGTYPATLEIDPDGDRTIASPQTLGSITMVNSNLDTVASGDSDQELLRIDFPVSGTGSPQTLQSITVTSANSQDSDVTGVTVYYTGTSQAFSTSTVFGTPDLPFGGGEVTFTDLLDFETPDATHSIFIAFDVSDSAINGDILDAKILTDDILIEGITVTPVDGNPTGSRTVFIPTGNIEGLAPCKMQIDADPSYMSGQLDAFYNTADYGDCTTGDTIASLENNDANYAGLDMDDSASTNPSWDQKEWVEFSYDLSSYGIRGRDINSLNFSAEAYLVGTDSTTGPAAETAWWNAIYDAKVQIFNYGTGLWEDMGESFLTPTASNWYLSTEASLWDDTTSTHPEKPLTRTKPCDFTDDYLNSSDILKVRVWVSGTIRDTAYNASMAFDYATIDFNYGSNIEQICWRWLDSDESPVAELNMNYTAAEMSALHVRVAVRSNNAPVGSHYFGVQYDTDPDFSAPTLMTTTTTDFQYWDDINPDHLEGDAVSIFYIDTTDSAGIYHEDQIPPSSSKVADTTYEEDFTVKPLTDGTYYLRLVFVDGGGSFASTLDSYGTPISLVVVPSSRIQAAYNWMPNTSPYTPIGIDSPLEFTVGSDYILAFRLDEYSGSNYTWSIQYQKNPYTDPGEWTTITTTSSDWRAVNGAWGWDNAVVYTTDYVTGTGSLVEINGRYDENGSTTGTIAANRELETWWSIQPQSGSENSAYRFRLTNTGTENNITYESVAEAQQSYSEQVSYHWADENESSITDENQAANVSIGQALHLRAGIRNNHSDWSGHYLALQYDTTESFSAPVLITSSSGDIIVWDDTGHLDGDTMSGTNLLSGSPYDGIYHEDENQPAGQDKTKNLIYEEDFTVTISATGTYYLRVVEVNSLGGNPQALDLYSETISVTAVQPSNTQAYYAWAADATSPSFSSTNAPLGFAPGNKYLLAAQIANESAVASIFDWQLQYKKTNDPPGVWTSISTTSTDWLADNCAFGVDGKTIAATGDFVLNSGSGTGSAQNGMFSETGYNSATLNGYSYTEFWYCVRPAGTSSQNTYEFRMTNSGSTSGFNYVVYPEAIEPTTEMVSFRWADENEAGVSVENSLYYSAPNEQIHLRVGIRSNGEAFNNHYLALQYATDISFTSPVIITTSSSGLKMWDDTDHVESSVVTGAKILSDSNAEGIYHEDETSAVQNKSKDLVYEEDFSIETVLIDDYFIRVIEVDSSGNFLRVLNEYTNIAELSVQAPTTHQTLYDWSPNQASPAWNGDNAIYEFTPETNYIVAIKIENEYPVPVDFDWQLQYQRDPYIYPGAWTNITTTSSEWYAADGSYGTDGDAIPSGIFATTGTEGCATCTVETGVYSEDGKTTSFSLNANSYTEIWYSITPDSTTDSHGYRFRATNSGSNYGISYSAYAEAITIKHEQGNFRWADANESAIDAENTQPDVSQNQLIHLRVGVQSRNAAWNGHYLALQYDTSSDFSSPSLVTTSSDIKAWDDADNNEGDTITTSNILSGTPWDGIYHEDENQPASQDKVMNIYYEEDFTIQPTVTGTYYMRVVEVDSSGANPQALDLYSSTISLNVVPANNNIESYNWAQNEAAPSFTGEDTPTGMVSGRTYIVAFQVDNIGGDASYNWQLQYQKDPYGTAGPWTNVTTYSTDWRAVNGVYGNDGDTVSSGSFSTTYSGTGSAQDGIYNETGIVSSFTLSGGSYTEFWYSIQPQTAAMSYDYRFRLTNSGSTSGITYNVYPEAKHPPTTGSIAITETGGCCTGDSTPTLTVVCEDPAGTACTAADSMKFSCDETTWSSWMPYSGTVTTFDITTGAGCNSSDGEKTVYVEFKNEFGAVQTSHANDTTVYDTTPPEITGITNIQTIVGNDCPLHGTSDGVTCDTALNPACTAWYQSSLDPPTPGSPNQFTIVVNWSDNMEAYGSKWKIQGSSAFGDVQQSADTSSPWQQFYNIDSSDITDQVVTITVYDVVGLTDTVNIDMQVDNEDPDNPSVSGYDTSSKVTSLVNDTWYNYSNPYFEWTGATDNPVGDSVGAEGFYVEFTTNSALDPSTYQTSLGVTVAGPLTSGETYYLRIKTADDVCNVSDAETTFTYKYDADAPDQPSVTGYDSSAKSQTLTSGNTYMYPNPYFEWAAVADNPATPNSGLKQYKIYFGTDSAGVPVLSTTSIFYEASGTLEAMSTYYLNLVAEDNAGNLSATETFTYVYEASLLNVTGTDVAATLTNNVTKGQQDILFESIDIESPDRTVDVTELNIDLIGTGADADISAAKLFRDADGNGAYDSGTDTQLGADKTFSSGALTFDGFTLSVATGTTETILVLYSIDAAATQGNTVGVSIEDSASITTSPAIGIQVNLSVSPTESSTVIIMNPAVLTASFATATTPVNPNYDFTITMTVSNASGSSDAENVAPTPSALTKIYTLGASVNLVSGPTPASADIAAGGSQDFSYSFRATANGTVTFEAAAEGTESNLGTTVTSGTAQTNIITVKTTVTPLWVFNDDSNTQEFYNSAAPQRNPGSAVTLYVANQNGKLYALNMNSGAKNWEYNIGSAIRSTPFVKGGEYIVFFGDESGGFHAVRDNTGSASLVWSRSPASGAIRTAASRWINGVEKRLYFGSLDGSLYCLDYDGNTCSGWSNPSLGSAIYSTPALPNDGYVYVATEAGSVFKIDRTDGTIVSEFSGYGAIRTSAFVTLKTSDPADGAWLWINGDDSVFKVDTTLTPGNEKVWDFSPTTPIDAGVFSTDIFVDVWDTTSPPLTVYAGNENGCIYAINNDGTLMWKFPSGASAFNGAVSSLPFVIPYNFTTPSDPAAQFIYFTSEDHHFYKMQNSATAPELLEEWPFYTSGNFTASPSVFGSNNVIVIPSTDGNVYAFPRM